MFFILKRPPQVIHSASYFYRPPLRSEDLKGVYGFPAGEVAARVTRQRRLGEPAADLSRDGTPCLSLPSQAPNPPSYVASAGVRKSR